MRGFQPSRSFSQPEHRNSGCQCDIDVFVFSPSVLDRLNALLEPGGCLTINERGVIDGTTPRITPHPNFRYVPQS